MHVPIQLVNIISDMHIENIQKIGIKRRKLKQRNY